MEDTGKKEKRRIPMEVEIKFSRTEIQQKPALPKRWLLQRIDIDLKTEIPGGENVTHDKG